MIWRDKNIFFFSFKKLFQSLATIVVVSTIMITCILQKVLPTLMRNF